MRPKSCRRRLGVMDFIRLQPKSGDLFLIDLAAFIFLVYPQPDLRGWEV